MITTMINQKRGLIDSVSCPYIEIPGRIEQKLKSIKIFNIFCLNVFIPKISCMLHGHVSVMFRNTQPTGSSASLIA